MQARKNFMSPWFFSDILSFDNTYSMVREKTLHYLVSIVSPPDAADDSDDENTYLWKLRVKVYA